MVLAHAYFQRRVIPLDIFVREAREAAACAAVVDYGEAIKDMARSNIFPGDMLLKNFGVTRHGRVVFYDYDELCLLQAVSYTHLDVYKRQQETVPLTELDRFYLPNFDLGEMCIRDSSWTTWTASRPI